MTDHRLAELTHWVAKQTALPEVPLAMVSGDASFRRYFRRPTDAHSHSLIAVDCPPDKEPLTEFLKIAELLLTCGVSVPKVLHFDQALGFMLLSDLGDTLYLPELNNHSAEALYQQAITALLQMQALPLEQLKQCPEYSAEKLRQEMQLLPDWFLAKHLQIEPTEQDTQVLNQCFDFLIDSVKQQTQVFVHRDYHSRNLMVLEHNSPGIIDFQDAVIGPITYDLVSLFKDCYITWPRAQQLHWLKQYYQQAQLQGLKLPTFDAFVKDYDLMGLQRHIKVAGIFCRLFYRDGKNGYLKELPLVLGYIAQVLPLYAELETFHQWFNQRLLPLLDESLQPMALN